MAQTHFLLALTGTRKGRQLEGTGRCRRCIPHGMLLHAAPTCESFSMLSKSGTDAMPGVRNRKLIWVLAKGWRTRERQRERERERDRDRDREMYKIKSK